MGKARTHHAAGNVWAAHVSKRARKRDCPYFKVDVEFEARGLPERDTEERVTVEEDVRDITLKISAPYLQFSHND